MRDILLDKSGDIALDAEGDITLADSPVQAVMIKVRWFFNEWVFDPEKGIPYYDSVLVKKPDIEGIKKMLTRQIMEVDTVVEVSDMQISVRAAGREAEVRFRFRTNEGTYFEEVVLHG